MIPASILSSSSHTRVFVRGIFLYTNTIYFYCFCIVNLATFSEFFIYSSILLYSLNPLFTETDSSWFTLNESPKASKIKTLIIIDLAFANNTIWSCFFLFFLMIDLNFLIPFKWLNNRLILLQNLKFLQEH